MVVAKREEYYYPERTKVNKTTVKVRRKKTNRNVALKLKLLCSIGLVLVFCLSLLLRYTYIGQVRMEISQLNQEISSLSKQKDDLQIELDKIMESEWIESVAMDELGMDYPNSSQTVYVSVDEEAFKEEVAEEEEQGFVFLKSFRGFLNEIFGLL